MIVIIILLIIMLTILQLKLHVKLLMSCLVQNHARGFLPPACCHRSEGGSWHVFDSTMLEDNLTHVFCPRSDKYSCRFFCTVVAHPFALTMPVDFSTRVFCRRSDKYSCRPSCTVVAVTYWSVTAAMMSLLVGGP